MEQLANEIYEYIANQEQPVSVGEIAGHLAKKPDRRTLNQLLLDMAWQGDLKKTLKDGKAYYTAPEARHAKILSQLDAEITRLENMAKDLGYDLHPSNIGDTGFDMYRWTFTKGTRKSGSGWSVAIPDGFSVIESASGRAFEAVPQGTESEELSVQKVQLLSGKAYDFSAIQGEKWSYHLQARKDRVDAFTATMGQITMKTVGAVTGDSTPPDGFSVVTDQVSASVLVQDTDGGSFSYQIQMLTEGKSQPLRVQTSFMTQEQKANLTKSVTEWVKTFRFDKPNSAIPKKAPLSDPQILTNLKNGYTSAFDSAVDLAVEEAKYGLTGQLALQKYRVEQDLVEGDGSADVQTAMDSGMEIVAYYVQLADTLVGKLQQGKLPAKTMSHVYTKLQALNMEMRGLSVNNVPINGSVPDAAKGIFAKWEQAMAKLQKAAPPKPTLNNAPQPPTKPGRDSKSTSDSSVQDYVSRSERKLRNFRREWETFTEDVPSTLRELVTQGTRPTFSSSNTGGQIGISMSFDQDMSEAKQYMEELRDRMDQALAEIRDEIMDIDRDMERFRRNGLDSRQLAKLVDNLNGWIDYIPEMRFAITDEKAVNFRIPPEVSEIQRKWKRIARDAPQRSTVDVPKAPPRSPASPSVDDIKERVKQKALKREEEYRPEREVAERAKADEYQRKMQDYRATCAKHELDEKKVKREREAHFQRLCDNERNSRINELDRVYYSTCAKAKTEISNQKKRRVQAERALNQLEFWNFIKKSEQKKIIEDAERIIAREEAVISDAKQTWEKEKGNVSYHIKRKEQQFRETAQKAHPMPAKPTEPEKPTSPQTTERYPTCGSSRSYSGTPSEAALQNRRLAEILMERMEYGIWYNGAELVELLQDECPGCARSKLAAIMRHTGEDVEYDSRESGRVYRLRESGSRSRSGFRQPPQLPKTYAEENERLSRILLDRMEYDVGYTSLELAELIQDVCPGCSTSKISAIMRHVPEGRVEVEKVKGKNVYSLA